MKLKFYLKAWAVATTAIFLSTGCTDKEEEGGGKPIVPGQIGIEVTNIAATGADATITPEEVSATYYAGLIAKSEYDALGSDADQKLIKKDQDAIKISGKPIAEFLSKGVATQNYTDLEANTDYYVYAYGMETDGAVTTGVTKKAFKTAEPSIFDFEIKNVQETSANIVITPLDMEALYFFDIQKAAVCDAWGNDDQIIEGLFDMYGSVIGWLVTQGVYEYKNEDFELDYQLVPGTEYYVLAFGYDEDNDSANTQLVKKKFKTPGEAPKEVNFDFDVQVKAGNDITIAVTPSDDSAIYVWDIISATNYEGLGGNDDAIKEYLSYIFDDYLAEGYTIEEAVEEISVKGPDSYKYTGLSGGTTYYAWAICVDAKGNTIGKPSMSESFKTPDIPRGNASVTVSYTKYYDGDALYAADPVNFKDTRGKAFVPTTITPSSDAVHWYVGLYGKDYTDPASIEESVIISSLKTSPITDVKGVNYLASWNTASTFLAMATDADDKVGPIFRKLVTFTKSGVSPISDLLQQAPAKVPVRGNELKLANADKQFRMSYRTEFNTTQPAKAPLKKNMLGRKGAVAAAKR